MNKKIKNATKKEYDGVQFKSLLEVMAYKTLIENNFNPEYEKHTFKLTPDCMPNIPFYTKKDLQRVPKTIIKISENVIKDMREIKPITYTPDFIFKYKDKTIIVECKGFINDVYPYKMKLFRLFLEKKKNKSKYEIWEIYTKKQLVELINNLKNA